MMRRFTSGPKPSAAGPRVHRLRVGAVDPQPVAHAVVARQVRGRLGGGDDVVGGQPEQKLGDRDLVDLGTGCRQRLAGGEDDLTGLRGARQEVLDDPHPQARHAVVERLEQAGCGPLQRGRVHRVVTGDDLEAYGRVGDRRREGPDLVERARKGDQPVARDDAVGGFHPDDPAQRGWLADRAARVAAEGEGHHSGCHRRRASARGAARHAAGVPGVARRSEGRVLRRGPHGELVEVGLADREGAGAA